MKVLVSIGPLQRGLRNTFFLENCFIMGYNLKTARYLNIKMAKLTILLFSTRFFHFFSLVIVHNFMKKYSRDSFAARGLLEIH